MCRLSLPVLDLDTLLAPDVWLEMGISGRNWISRGALLAGRLHCNLLALSRWIIVISGAGSAMSG